MEQTFSKKNREYKLKNKIHNKTNLISTINSQKHINNKETM